MPNLRSKTWTTSTPATVGDAQFWEDHLISDTDVAKIGSSVQSVNGNTPDGSGNVNVVALPNGGTVGQVLTKQSSADGDADWDDPASSGHTIEDEDGIEMPQQDTLQFVNAEVSNDGVNHKTVVDCKGSKGDPGIAATITVGNVSTLPAGSSATVVNSGTSSAAVFDFGIPEGADGTNGTDGTDGVGVTGVALISTSGKVKTYRMSFSDSSYFDYNVTDGTDGTGAGDMLQSDYDSLSDVYNAGGIPSYVSSAISGKVDASALANVATSGDYDDLTNKPTIPAAQVNANWNAVGGVAEILNKPNLHAVATSGSYTDLENKPSIPAAQVNADWDAISGVQAILHKPTIPAAQIQSDWDQADSTAKDYIKNKPSVLGHDMIPNNTAIASLTSKAIDSTDDDVASGYAIANWSNLNGFKVLTQVAEGKDTIGSWNDTWETDGDRTGWIFHTKLLNILSSDDYDITPKAELKAGEQNAIGYIAWRCDDDYYMAMTPSGTENPKALGWYESDGQTPPTYTLTNDTSVQGGKTYYAHGGCVAIKLNAPVPSNLNNVKIGVECILNRTQTFIV